MVDSVVAGPAFRPAIVDRSTLARTGVRTARVSHNNSSGSPAMTTSEGSTSQPATPQPTTSEPISFDVDLGTALIELDRKECLELLAAKSVGRLAYAAHYGARILPVNYVLADDSIIFRTLPNGAIFHHALNSMCAFEVDDTDEFFESGWSVVATGFLELATRDDFEHMRHGKLPQPWATGNRRTFVRLPCTQLSGRRVVGHGR